jgi:uncharacterized protein (UPF0332 family)
MKNSTGAALIRYRIEQAETALDDARFLLDGNRGPLSIINRAYYAMFYAALGLLQTAGKVPGKHTGVIGLFDTEFVQKGTLPKELSRDFHRAFEMRQKSDYRVTEPATTERATDLLDRAGRFVAAVREHLESGGFLGDDRPGSSSDFIACDRPRRTRRRRP